MLRPRTRDLDKQIATAAAWFHGEHQPSARIPSSHIILVGHAMTKKLVILCFGNSLTAGYYCYGLHYHPYAGKLRETLKAAYPDTEIKIDVDGVPGDLAISPPGRFLRRIQDKCFSTQYDWVIVLGGTK